jgi:hypothetical protein
MDLSDDDRRFTIPIIFRQGNILKNLQLRSNRSNRTIDMLASVKTAMAQASEESRTDTYKSVSMKLLQCSAMYDAMATAPPPDATPEKLSNLSSVYKDAAGILYVGSSTDYQQALVTANESALRQYQNIDRKSLFDLLRGCWKWSHLQPASAEKISSLLSPP